MGINLTEGGRLSFNRDYVDSLSQDKINIAIGENIEIFTSLHRQTGSLLTEPLSGHMNFKALGYHYNYKMGAMETDGFGVIEVGMLIDKAV